MHRFVRQERADYVVAGASCFSTLLIAILLLAIAPHEKVRKHVKLSAVTLESAPVVAPDHTFTAGAK
jgi:hypothetical protein